MPGQSAETWPWASWYQDVQPPVAQTVRAIRGSSQAFQAACASGRTSARVQPHARICRTASATYAACASSISTMLLAPSPVFGPVMRNRFGKPVTVVPRWACGRPAQCSARLRPSAPNVTRVLAGSVTSKPVAKMSTSASYDDPSAATSVPPCTRSSAEGTRDTWGCAIAG